VRPGLAVVTDALVTRIVLDGRRATGIEYLQRGQRVAANADDSTVVSFETIGMLWEMSILGLA